MEKKLMKKILLLSIFLSFISQAAPLAGDYFINQSGSEDYSSINAAVADLEANGISAPVNFRIRTGTYNERVVLNNITRAGQLDDRVVFKRATPSDTVIIKNLSQDSTFNFVFKLADVKYISFVNLEFEATNANYQHLIEYTGDTDSVTIANSTFRGLNYNNIISNRGELIYSLTNNPLIDATSTGLIFTGNTFENGYSGLSVLGSNKPTNTISNNLFSNQAIESLVAQSTTTDSIINNNSFDSSYVRTLNYTALVVGGSGTVKNNEIILNSLGTAEIGMNIFGNLISTPLLVYNNTISSTNPVGNSVGIDVSNNVKLLHNSIKVEHVDDIPLNVSATDGDSVWIDNNLLINTGFGKAIVATTDANKDAVAELFDNNYYTSGGIVSFWGDSTSYTNVGSFQLGVYAKHPHIGISRSVNFVNASTGNLRLIGSSIGDKFLVAHPQAEVTLDIDGETRGTLNTYIGADIPSSAGSSIAAMDNLDANNGTFYSIGGTSPDYVTAQEAFDDLYRRGMKGQVKFRLRPGTYSVNANFYHIIKQNPIDSIIITSSSPTNGVLSFSGDSNPNNILRFDETSNITIDGVDFDLGITAANAIEFNNCNNTSINNSSFNAGDKAIEILSSTTSDNHTISNNSFSNQNINAIHLDSVTTIDIDGNNIDSSAASFKGILLANSSSSALTIQNNKFRGVGTVIGIYLDDAKGEVNNRGLIANNFISTNKGIFVVNSSSNWNIFHNSINTNATAITLKALTGLKPSNFDFKNNIFQTPTGVVNLRINEFETQADDNIILDYNTYYNQIGGGILIKWYGIGFTTLNSFTANTGMDFNSHKKMVNFVNAATGNLHLAGTSVGDNELAGTNCIVTSDIDGDVRATVFPYMGADETTALNPARIQVTANGNQSSEDGTQTIELSFVLLSQPSDNVIVSVVSNDSNEATIDNTDMIFTPLNWNTPQLKIVNGVDDNIMEGDISYSISSTISSADSNYNNLAVQDINLVNIDDDISALLKLEVINPMAEPNTAGMFRISLVKPLLPPNDTPLVNAQNVTVNFETNSSSANVGIDYTDASGSIVIPAHTSAVDINISPLDDFFIESLEHIIVILTGKSGGVGNISLLVNTFVELDIIDNENGLISVSNPTNLTEPASDGSFDLVLTGGVSETDTDISFYFAGTAFNASDYTVNSTIVTIPALGSSVTVPLSVIDDIDSEDQEFIVANLISTNNANIPVETASPPLIYVNDDDTSADIAISITPNNPTFNTATVTNLVFTLTNNSPINIHQAVLQSTEPVGLNYVNWQCLAAVQYCSQTAGMGDISEVISIDANSQIQFSVDVLATTTPTTSLSVQAILNPAPFLTDTDPSNNTAIATSLLEIIFQNGFETSLNKQLYQAVTAFDQQDSINSHYYFIDDSSTIYHFIQIDKENNTVRYRHVYVDTINQKINQSAWISHDK
jgi:hypothetical protein